MYIVCVHSYHSVAIYGVDNIIHCHLEFVVNESSKTVTCSEHTTNNTNETHCNCEVFIGLAVVFIVISVITTTIIVILSWKLCNQKRNNGNLRIVYSLM